jgi:hypothetical protein
MRVMMEVMNLCCEKLHRFNILRTSPKLLQAHFKKAFKVNGKNAGFRVLKVIGHV